MVGLLVSFRKSKLFGLLTVTAVEFIYATSGVNKFHLTSVEWVRSIRNLDLNNWELNTINFNSLFCINTAACDEYMLI